MLAGKTRLELLRLVASQPNQTVTDLATQLQISLPRASQELRRIQSRGLLQAVRSGLYVRYRPVPDRLVPTARPLLQAVQEVFRRGPQAEDEQTLRIATAFSHEHRLALARLLLIGPMGTLMLEELAGLKRNTLNRHLRRLHDAGIIQRNGKMISITENPHPLAQCLLGILKSSPPAPA